MTLKQRLLAGFLFCAIITAISVGVGIYSLRNIEDNQKKTFQNIDSGITTQTTHSSQVAAMSSIKIQIANATSVDNINAIEKAFLAGNKNDLDTLQQIETQIAKGNKVEKSERYEALSEIINLIEFKREELKAIAEFAEIESKINSTLFGIRKTINNTVEKVIRSNNVTLSISASCHEINAKIKEILLQNKVDYINLFKQEIDKSFSDAKDKLSSLKETESIAEIKNNFGTLDGFIQNIVEAKTDLLNKQKDKQSSYIVVQEQKVKLDKELESINKFVLGIADDAEFEATIQSDDAIENIKSIASSGNNQNIEKNLSELSKSMTDSISLVKAAFMVKAYCDMQNILIKDIILSEDKSVVDFYDKKMKDNYAGAINELKNIPDSDNKSKLEKTLKSLDKIITSVVLAKKELLKFNSELEQFEIVMQEDQEKLGKNVSKIISSINSEVQNNSSVSQIATAQLKKISEALSQGLNVYKTETDVAKLESFHEKLTTEHLDAVLEMSLYSEFNKIISDLNTLGIGEGDETGESKDEALLVTTKNKRKQMLECVEQFNIASTKIDSLLGKINSDLVTSGDVMMKSTSQSMVNSRKLVRNRSGWMWVLLVVAVVLAIVIGYIVLKSIINPINKAVGLVEVISSGDLTQTIGIESDDELGKLSRALDSMVSDLNVALDNISDTADNVAQASNEISSNADQGASGSEQQSRGINDIASQTTELATQMETVSTQVEEMSASVEQASVNIASQVQFVNSTYRTMEDMVSSVDTVSQNAQEAKELSTNSVSYANQGNVAVNKAVSGMEQITITIHDMANVIEKLGKRSDQIGEILNTINSIAAQTNLLALNAAIEAARAGEHGRGFAVVADEVRKLAEGTANATEEISGIVRGIQDESQNAILATKDGMKKVQEGTELTYGVGEVLNQMIKAISQTSDAVSRIAKSTVDQKQSANEVCDSMNRLRSMSEEISKGMQEQNIGVQEINNAILEAKKAVDSTALAAEEISGIVEQSASGARELATSAVNLSNQADFMMKNVSKFQTIKRSETGMMEVNK